jgi:truncated hemoglobin YjbI
MVSMVCNKCGVAASEAKPSRCAKCGNRDFYESKGSAFSSKPTANQPNLDAQKNSAPKNADVQRITLFDKYGGVPTIANLVRAFHTEILTRKHLAVYFEGVELSKLAEHTVLYLAFVMGKPAETYTGRDMYKAHAHLHIHGMHYDEVADVLKDVLTAGGVSKPDIALIMKHVESLRELIAV